MRLLRLRHTAPSHPSEIGRDSPGAPSCTLRRGRGMGNPGWVPHASFERGMSGLDPQLVYDERRGQD